MIYTLTLNTALDRIVYLDKELIKKHNNKVNSVTYDIGGKATHVSVVLSTLNIPNIALGVIGGHTGDKLVELLQKKNVKCQFIKQKGVETRESILLVDNKGEGSYMITEPGFIYSDGTFNSLLNFISSYITEEDFVVVCGSMPRGTPIQDFNVIINAIKRKTDNLFIDTSGDYLLESIKYKPKFIKPNQYEFAEIVNKNLITLEDYIKEIREFSNKGIENVVVSLGKDGCLVNYNNDIYKVTPPEVEEVNDTGCGDSFVGGYIAKIYQGSNVLEAIKFATSISASKATHNDSSSFNLEQAKEFYKNIKIEKLT